MKKQNGITLIALVITIIVLLILAGVTISLVIGDNGILTQATGAVKENKAALAREEVSMAWTSVDSDYWAAWTKDTSKIKEDYFKEENLNKYLLDKGKIVTGTLDSTYNPDGPNTFEYVRFENPEITYTVTIYKTGKVTIVEKEETETTPTTPAPNSISIQIGGEADSFVHEENLVHIEIRQTVTLIAVDENNNPVTSGITWTSSNPTVAPIENKEDGSCVVKGGDLSVQKSETEVTITAKYGTLEEATFTVVVWTIQCKDCHGSSIIDHGYRCTECSTLTHDAPVHEYVDGGIKFTFECGCSQVYDISTEPRMFYEDVYCDSCDGNGYFYK